MPEKPKENKESAVQFNEGAHILHHLGNAWKDDQIADLKVSAIEGAIHNLGIDIGKVFYDGAGILEIGAGAGANQSALKAKHPSLRYTEVEINPTLAQLSKDRNPDGNIVNAGILQYIDSVPDNSQAAILEFNAFDQYTYPQLKILIRKIHNKIKPGGIFLGAVDQIQAPLPMITYLREKHRTPDGIRGHPFLVCTDLGEAGITTGAIYLGTQKAQRKIRDEVRKLRTMKTEGSPLESDDTMACDPKDLKTFHQDIVRAGMTCVDHNKLLQDIIAEIAAVHFEWVTQSTHLMKKIEMSDGVLSEPVIDGIFSEFEAESVKREMEAAVSQKAQKLTVDPSRLQGFVHKASFVVAEKKSDLPAGRE